MGGSASSAQFIPRPEQDRIPARALVLLALIVLLAALLRFPDLQRAPVGGHGDVAWVGLNALDWIDRGIWPFYVRELYSPEFPVVLLNGLLIPITGISYLPPRLITAFSGLLFVALLFPATWWLTREKPRLFRERASLLAALAGAVSLHAMYLSRLGMESPPFLAAVTLVVWLTAWAWHHPRIALWALAGAALALAQYIYLPARLLPIVLILWIGHAWLTDRQWLRLQWRGWLTMAVVAFILTLPAIILFITVPGSFSGRADTGTAITGGWAWNYDTSAAGGLLVLMLKKIGLTLLGLGITFNGEYTMMGQPMLTPLFFVGFLIAVGALIRAPRDISVAWPALAIPVMLITDLISGAVVEVHALHQMGILPFVFILAGVGLAYGWAALDRSLRLSIPRWRALLTGLALLAIVPSFVGTYRYLREFIPAQYADPENGWRTEQIDVDMSERIVAQPDRAYLLPYAEYSRSNVAWLVSQAFRERLSPINADGQLQIPQPPANLTVVMTDQPDRPRHDGRPSVLDTRLWVLLQNNQTLLLPPLTPAQEQALLGGLKSPSAQIEPLLDRSHTEIATFTTLPTPADLFAPRPVIDHPIDATFNDEVQLKGYTIRDENLTPGKIMFVTLYWQVKAQPGEDYEIFAQVWNDAKQSLAGTHDFPYGGAYRVRIWRPGEIVATQHWLALPDNLPAGRYTLAIGMTHLIGDRRLPVSGANADPSLQVALAPDLRYPLPQATPGTSPPHNVQFGDVFNITGLDASLNGHAQKIGTSWQAAPNQTLKLNVTWKALKRPPQDYSVFLHISPTANAQPVAQLDAVMGGAYPAGTWRTGDLVRDHLTLTLPADLPPGSYQVLMGVYYWQTGERLPVAVDKTQQADSQVQIGTLIIGSRAPQLTF